MPDSESKLSVMVSLRSILARYRPNRKDRKPFPVELEVGATVADLLAKLGVSDKLVHLVFVDHVRADHAKVLEDDAAVDIFPPIAGG